MDKIKQSDIIVIKMNEKYEILNSIDHTINKGEYR
jgi:hypothetical protein